MRESATHSRELFPERQARAKAEESELTEIPKAVDPAEWLRNQPHLFCEKLKILMPERDCLLRQFPLPTKKWTCANSVEKSCASGQCAQGVALLLRLGVLPGRECPRCSGLGMLPTPKPRSSVERLVRVLSSLKPSFR